MALRVTADFGKPEVSLEQGVLRINCEIANRTAAPWTIDESWTAGYHVFDEPTGTLVVDGERTPLDLAPGQSRTLQFTIPLPPEPGEYNVYVSVLREHVAWFYERG